MKEVRFHPQAKAEMLETVRFYEARFEGLGFRFLSAVEQTSERISAHPEADLPLKHGFRKRIVPEFPYNVIYCVCGKITSISRYCPPTSTPWLLAETWRPSLTTSCLPHHLHLPDSESNRG